MRTKRCKRIVSKSKKGEIKDFTGVNAPYEVPLNPDLIIDTSKESIIESVNRILEFIDSKMN